MFSSKSTISIFSSILTSHTTYVVYLMGSSDSQALFISFSREPSATYKLEPLDFSLILVDQMGNDGDRRLNLTDMIINRATCQVWRGKLQISSNTHDIVAKLSIFTHMQPANLRGEAENYQNIIDLQGTVIPKFFGLYDHPNIGQCLVLEDCGNPSEYNYRSWSST